MAEYTDDDVTRLAEMLRPHFVSYTSPESLAHLLLEQGVTLPPPPPDPADVVAEALWASMYAAPWQDENCDADDDAQHALLAALRDLIPPEALAGAAAKVQGAGS